MTTAPLPPPDYATWLQDVKARIQAARIAVARAANRELILLYWDLGRGIVEKQEAMGWGKSVVETLSADHRIVRDVIARRFPVINLNAYPGFVRSLS